jgi:quinolinate synthase
MEYWPGYCPTHARIRPEDIQRAKAEHPAAKVVAHPECRPETTALADEILSTGGMIRFAKNTLASEVIVGTEIGLVYRLRKENPEKCFYPVSEQAVCPRMKLITLDKIVWSLENLAPEVKVPDTTRMKAKKAVDRMLEIG